MASFQAKIGWKRQKREKIKIIVTFCSYPTGQRKFQKNSKKLKKLKNTTMASFQAKIGWERLRKRENKNYRSVPFQPDEQQIITKKQPKNSKN